MTTSTTLGALADDGVLAIGDGYRTKASEYEDGGIPILRVADVLEGVISPSYKDRVSLSRLPKIGAKQSRPGDVIVTTKGTVGRVALIPESLPSHVYSPQLCYLRVIEHSRVDKLWLYSWARSPQFQRQTGSVKDQTDMAPYVSLGDLRRFRIEVPSLDEQQRIAGVLGALDELINSNQLLIEQSRALSRALFHSMPEDRLQCRLGDVARVNPIRVRPERSGDLVYIDIASLGDGYIDWPAPMSWGEAPGRARRGARLGSTLWSNVRPNRLGHAMLLHTPENLVVSTGISVLEPRDVGPAELHEISQTDAFVAHLVARSDGSAYPAVTASVFEDAPVERLSAEDSARFEEIAWPLWVSIGQLENESEQLRRARDELLPLLMSGAVRVRPVEDAA